MKNLTQELNHPDTVEDIGHITDDLIEALLNSLTEERGYREEQRVSAARWVVARLKAEVDDL